MKILITTPFFQFSGGSELETIHTANTFASLLEVEEVHVFVAGEFDLNFTKNIYIDRKVKFFTRPFFFNNVFFYKINKSIKRKLRLESLPFDFLYWKFKKLSRFDKIYIITKTSLVNDYIPLIQLYKSKKDIVIKYTTVFFNPLENSTIRYLSQIRYNIVTSQKQKEFFIKNLDLKNTVAQEILLFNEDVAINKVRNQRKTDLYDFGILGRYSEEKQFEHAINLIANLRDKGVKARLIIKGGCDQNYYKSLKNLAKEKNLEELITISFEEVQYDEVYNFFDLFNCFLITSKYEGGPNVALEIMAYGLPILSYDVGAMKDRLNKFPELIAIDEEDLSKKAIEILNYGESLFLQKCIDIKKAYIDEFSNDKKVAFLRDFLN
ncbi:glycosyltransferase family 4 protein [Flavobacterium humidisoli]|uniref:Glycosyltransferase family 4 protein n=1 Tax=Flavobacterium humidisoli TaxID=2937442 RepID=A0ABY4LSJ7_9FLAO|nr:glycosyltransferase family 4 protein [Flavobacterium humidisoli]UPZ16047.1 glycosyltransferase family 4 protein [Flavobacterium humidisoli]